MEVLPFPIAHWSPSSMCLLLRNALMFKKQYIEKIYDNTFSPASLMGRAGHGALKSYFEGMEVPVAIEDGYKIIRQNEFGVKWGKTGSIAKLNQDYAKAIQGYFEEMPDYYDPCYSILLVEKPIIAYVEFEGKELPLPIKAIADLVVERVEEKEIDIIDHKFVSAYTDKPQAEGEALTEAKPMKASYIIQAMCNYHTVKKELGRAPTRFIFREHKSSKNSDGSPQTQEVVIVYDEHPEYHTFFFNIYRDLTDSITNPSFRYLPNFDDMFDGDQAFNDYFFNLIGSEAPTVREHRTVQTEIVEKKYVESAPIAEDNKHYTEEEKIRLKFQEFGIPVKIEETHKGASVSLYTMKPGRGVQMSKIKKHEDDLKIALGAHNIRIMAPLPGTNFVGVEVPNKEQKILSVPSPETWMEQNTLRFPVGEDVYGNMFVRDLIDMPHLMVAGTTGSGKSVMVNVIIKSIMEENTSETLKMILIDPKRVELSQYKGSEFMLTDPIYDTTKAVKTFHWLVQQMEMRYEELEEAGVKNIEEYVAAGNDMFRIVVVVDEFADLMMQSGGMIESSVVRLAQKARAVGIHLILATQRPTVDVMTGLIKANIGVRIAFRTTSQIDSKVVLDQSGSESLLGKGDMLLMEPGQGDFQRLQGYYV